jgi:hypothetical protein
MSTGWAIDAEFATVFQVEWRAPATEAELKEAEAAMNVPLPELVREWYRVANGGASRAPRTEISLLALEEVMNLFNQTVLAKRGHFPFVDNNDSDPICIVCRGPLLGYVTQWEHDGEPRVLYRSVAGFFREAVEQLAKEGYLDTHELKGDFAAPERTDDDLRIGRELVQTIKDGKATKMAAATRLMFAADLLDDVTEIREAAELGNEYVWDHVMRRLAQLGTPAAEAALSAMRTAYDDFAEKCAALLRGGGFEVEVKAPYGRKSLTMNRKIHLNMDAFFAQRSRPDFDQYLLDWAREAVARKQAQATKGA